MTGTVAIQHIMGVTFVPVVGGKADAARAEPVSITNGKYDTWVAPGKYELWDMDANRRPGKKLRDVTVGTTAMTVDVTAAAPATQ